MGVFLGKSVFVLLRAVLQRRGPHTLLLAANNAAGGGQACQPGKGLLDGATKEVSFTIAYSEVSWRGYNLGVNSRMKSGMKMMSWYNAGISGGWGGS